MNESGGAPVSESGAKLFRAAFDLEAEDENWPPVLVERLWGEKTEVKYELRIVNTPFFVRGIAFGDLVRVRPDHERRELVFDSFTSESGHSAALLVFLKEEKRVEIESRLRELGCSVGTLEGFGNLISVDVLPDVDYGELRMWLDAQSAAGEIGIRENAISELHRRQLPEFA